MVKRIQRANERGKADYGWLKTFYSFSFSDYYNPSRMGFGKLRVLNDDIISAGSGFGSHPHSNMEIITIPLEGELAHKDSTGVEEVISVGDVQVMSAGSGIVHSEYNHSKKNDVKLFQIWIETKEKGIKPRHDQRSFDLGKNKLVTVVSGGKEGLYIHQDAKISLGKFDSGKVKYGVGLGKGVFILVIEGKIKVLDEVLNRRDSIETDSSVEIEVLEESYFMIIEVSI